MVDINKLKSRIAEQGYSIGKLAQEIGINRATLYRKISSNGESISIKEANAIAKILNLTPDEANSIFFSQIVA